MADPRKAVEKKSDDRAGNLQNLFTNGDDYKLINRVSKYIKEEGKNKASVILKFFDVTGIKGLDRFLDGERLKTYNGQDQDEMNAYNKLSNERHIWLTKALSSLQADKNLPTSETWDYSQSGINNFIQQLKTNQGLNDVDTELSEFIAWEKKSYSNDTLFPDDVNDPNHLREDNFKKIIMSAVIFQIGGTYSSDVLQKAPDKLSEGYFLKIMGIAYTEANPHQSIRSRVNRKLAGPKQDIIKLCDKSDTILSDRTLTFEFQSRLNKYCQNYDFLFLPTTDKVAQITSLHSEVKKIIDNVNWNKDEKYEINRIFTSCLDTYRAQASMEREKLAPELLNSIKVVEKLLRNPRLVNDLAEANEKLNQKYLADLTSQGGNAAVLAEGIKKYHALMQKTFPSRKEELTKKISDEGSTLSLSMLKQTALNKMGKSRKRVDNYSKVINTPDLFQLYIDIKTRNVNPDSPIAHLFNSTKETEEQKKSLAELETALDQIIEGKLGKNVLETFKLAAQWMNSQITTEQLQGELKKREQMPGRPATTPPPRPTSAYPSLSGSDLYQKPNLTKPSLPPSSQPGPKKQ